eukprot:gene4803-biopygen15098
MSKEAFFNKPTYADLRLVLRSSQGGSSTSNDDLVSVCGSPPAKRQCTGLPLDNVCSFYTHKVILASKSPVINAMLHRAEELKDLQAVDTVLSVFLVPMECSGSVKLLVTPPTHQPTNLQLEVLELPMEQEELLACEVLLRSMYSDDLAEEVRRTLSSEEGADVSRVKLLVQVYRLADRLEVCTDQCAQAIPALSSADCDSVDTVNSVFSLKRSAPALAEHATIRDLMERCLSWLLTRFDELLSAVWDDCLTKEFQQLDFQTVLSFLESDELVVASENEVLTLMGMWMGDDRADQMSKEQLGAFWNVLRLGSLTPSFLSNLDVVAPWLPVDPDVLRRATQFKMYKTNDYVKAVSMQKMLQSVYGSSVAWFKNARKTFDATWPLTFCFSASCLADLLTMVQRSGAHEDLHVGRAPPMQYNGYDLFPTLSVQLLSDGSEKIFVLTLGFEVRTSAFISKGVPTLVHIKASCSLCSDTAFKRDVDDIIHGSLAWELTRVDTLDDFSCLESYLNQSGELQGALEIRKID